VYPVTEVEAGSVPLVNGHIMSLVLADMRACIISILTLRFKQ